jgi:transposase
MRSVHDFSSVLLHKAPVDGRKQINGLAALVQGAMGQNPFSGTLFAFTTRRRDVIKLLYWDRTGFAMWVKRLEEEKFRWPLKIEGDMITLTADQLSWLLDGIDIMRMKTHTTLAYSAVS